MAFTLSEHQPLKRSRRPATSARRASSPAGGAPSAPSESKITVMVADAVPLMAESLAGMLSREPDFQVLPDRPGGGLAAVEAILALRPDVALIDYWMDDMEGQAVVRLVRSRQPDRKIIILSWFHGTQQIERSLDAGAAGFLPKTVTVATVAEGIRKAHGGESPVYLAELEAMFLGISKRTDVAAELWKRMEGLSPRQLEILTLLSLNLAPKEVAERLSISRETVKVHLRNILEKTDCHSYVDVLTMARACGLIRN